MKVGATNTSGSNLYDYVRGLLELGIGNTFDIYLKKVLGKRQHAWRTSFRHSTQETTSTKEELEA